MEVRQVEKKNFDFVDTIRCFSMMGIVFEHCTTIGVPNYANFYSGMFQASVMQFFKFATIAFFLIAGFLINYKFTEYGPWEYLRNRFKNTIKPWLFWLNVLILLNVINLLVKCFRRGSSQMPDSFFSYLAEQYHYAIFFTSFWFILNFLICIAILLIFKKYIYKLWFGLILAVVSLFYSINLYYDWIITNHSTALFGFVVYLWLGVMMNKHFDKLGPWIHKTSIWWLVGLTTVLFFLADLEAVYLKNLNIEDAYNTLRITNILYSLSFFLLLLKIGPIKAINKYLLPRETTFGIYLIHYIVIQHILTELLRPLKINVNTITLVESAAYSVLRFLIVYVLSIALVMLIRRTKLRWSIGLS